MTEVLGAEGAAEEWRNFLRSRGFEAHRSDLGTSVVFGPPQRLELDFSVYFAKAPADAPLHVTLVCRQSSAQAILTGVPEDRVVHLTWHQIPAQLHVGEGFTGRLVLASDDDRAVSLTTAASASATVELAAGTIQVQGEEQIPETVPVVVRSGRLLGGGSILAVVVTEKMELGSSSDPPPTIGKLTATSGARIRTLHHNPVSVDVLTGVPHAKEVSGFPLVELSAAKSEDVKQSETRLVTRSV